MIDVACICQDEQETIGWMLRACQSIGDNLRSVVIVDGGSTDDTLDIINAWSYILPIMVIRHSFDNFCDQKNRALERCAADWIVLADADMTWGSNLAWELKHREDLQRVTCIDVPLFYTFQDAHHYRNDMVIGGSVRITRNVGCRYVQPIHEYLVWPGEENPKDRHVMFDYPERRPDWRSISQIPRLYAYGEIPFFEHTWRKSDEALRAKARRYRRFAEYSTKVGVFMDGDEDYLVKEKYKILKRGAYEPLPKGRDRFVVRGT